MPSDIVRPADPRRSVGWALAASLVGVAGLLLSSASMTYANWMYRLEEDGWLLRIGMGSCFSALPYVVLLVCARTNRGHRALSLASFVCAALMICVPLWALTALSQVRDDPWGWTRAFILIANLAIPSAIILVLAVITAVFAWKRRRARLPRA